MCLVDLKAGDIIAIECPLFKGVNDFGSHLRCFNCLKSNKLSLIPSSETTLAMFCSSNCELAANQRFFQAALDSKCYDFSQRVLFESLSICDESFEKLEKLMTDSDLAKMTAFDLDLSNGSVEYLSLVAFNSLQLGKSSEEMKFIDNPALEQKDEKIIAKTKNFLERIFRILATNNIGLDWLTPQKKASEDEKVVLEKIDVGSGVLILGSLFNHSCNHNIDRIIWDNKVVFFAKKPIAKGHQLFINYGQVQRTLTSKFVGKCRWFLTTNPHNLKSISDNFMRKRQCRSGKKL